MKTVAALLTALIATPAFAHPGHFGEVHGHNHWLAAGALALAAVIGAVAIWRARRTKPADKRETQAEKRA